MMLFVRVENVSLGIETKRLMKKPTAALGIRALAFSEGLVTAAGKPITAAELHRKAELFKLCRANVEEFYTVTYYLALLTVFNGNQMKAASYKFADLFGIKSP
jgi:hypothetical protein